MNKEELIKAIEDAKKDIELEKSFNSNSGELSFYCYRLYELEKELKELEENKNE